MWRRWVALLLLLLVPETSSFLALRPRQRGCFCCFLGVIRDSFPEPKPHRYNQTQTHLEKFFPDIDREWGIYRERPRPYIPSTLNAVTDAAWEAIVATMYNRARLDPFIVNNARARTIYEFRPVRKEPDRGRIGIEIGTSRFLFSNTGKSRTDANAVRTASLLLAAKLSQAPWEGYESYFRTTTRPVAVYFNTMKQSLVASRDLALLRQVPITSHLDFDDIIIQTLGMDEDLPRQLTRGKPNKNFARVEGVIDPKAGVIVVVQPTDFDAEFRPTRPNGRAIGSLQVLAMKAAVAKIPVVLVSPRFPSLYVPSKTWDQSGYLQASSYGGAEPPGGTPWLMRDFSPPVFVWVGSALPRLPSPSLLDVPAKDPRVEEEILTRRPRMVLSQTVMEPGHPWHVAAVMPSSSLSSSETMFQYLASINKDGGRPPSEVLLHILRKRYRPPL